MEKLRLPPVGLGTYLLKGQEARTIVEAAYHLGYRHFDTARFYENEKEIGLALKNKPRDTFQVTTKLWYDSMGYHPALNAFDRSQNDLEMEFVDLYLIHWPNPRGLILETLEALQKLKKEGKIRYYGLSNCTTKHLQDALDEGFEISALQVEYHPYLDQRELLEFCLKKQIQLIGYSPFLRGETLGCGNLFQDPLLVQLAHQYQKTTAQIILRWLLQKSIITIPKTSQIKRLKENKAIFDFELTQQEMIQINHLNQNFRMTNPDSCADFGYGFLYK